MINKSFKSELKLVYWLVQIWSIGPSFKNATILSPHLMNVLMCTFMSHCVNNSSILV
jgi:hypothetical protein